MLKVITSISFLTVIYAQSSTECDTYPSDAANSANNQCAVSWDYETIYDATSGTTTTDCAFVYCCYDSAANTGYISVEEYKDDLSNSDIKQYCELDGCDKDDWLNTDICGCPECPPSMI